MKRQLQLFIHCYALAISTTLGLTALSGCSKEGTTAITKNGSPYFMTATIGGASFSRDSCVFYHNNILDTSDADIVGWAGYPTTRIDYYPQIYLSFYSGYHGVGTYDFTNNNFSAELLLSDTSGGYATSGSITLTAIYPNVVGTFSFTAKGTTVTNGSFIAQRN